MILGDLVIGHATDAGRVRSLNEDSYLVLTSPAIAPDLMGLLVVADGMGGHNAGEVASRTLVQLFKELFTSSNYQRRVMYSPEHDDYYVVVLKESLEYAGEVLHRLALSRAELQGMGTTATVALLAGGHLYWGHVGDSRAYLFRDGQLHRLTTDHTWVYEEMLAGRLTPAEAESHPRRNVLTQSLGDGLPPRVERGMKRVELGDRLLLCSDGLCGVVADEELRRVLAEEPNTQAVCERLVMWANHRDGPDNITVVVGDLMPEGAAQGRQSGCFVGPPLKAEAERPPVVVAGAPEATESHRKRPTYLWTAFLVLVGAVLGVLGAMLVSLIWPSWVQDNLPARLGTVAVVIFAWGALLGRLS